MESKYFWAFKIGVFIVVLTWFSFTIYQLGKSILHGIDVPSTDVLATIGLSFRAAASFIAVITSIFYMVKRDLSLPELFTSLRFILLFEAVYWFSLLPSGIWGFQVSFTGYPRELLTIGTGVPCLTESVLIPVVLGVLFVKLSPRKPASGAIKWGTIAGASFIFVYWLLYTTQWLSDVILRGGGFLTISPLNVAGFVLTAGGLLVLTAYAAVYARKSFAVATLAELDLRRVGVILTAFGAYFLVELVLSLFFLSSNLGSSIMHTFFVYHNMDLWLASLPLVGLPLVLLKKAA